MSDIRVVGHSKGLPVGSSVDGDPGSVPNPVGIDHQHSFWSKWIEIPLMGKWAPHPTANGTPLYYSTCGNMVWIRGFVTWDNISGAQPTFPQPCAAARLPKSVRPDRDIRYETTWIDPDGYIYKVATSTYVYEQTPFTTFSYMIIDDLIFRTFV